MHDPTFPLRVPGYNPSRRPPLRRSVTEERRGPKPEAAQPEGRKQFGLPGGVARFLQTADEAERDSGGGGRVSKRVCSSLCALPFSPNCFRATVPTISRGS